MTITPLHALAIISVAGFITFTSRLIPFLFFKKGKVPTTVLYLGNALPPAMMALLIVYSLKDTNILQSPYGLHEAAGVIVVTCLHLWKRNTLVSIFGGTCVYMILVQLF